jgi:hypothetical protein
VYRSYDGYFVFSSALHTQVQCYLQVYEGRGFLPVAFVTRVPRQPNITIPPAANQLATLIWQQVIPQAKEGFQLIQVQHLPPGTRFFDADLRIAAGSVEVVAWHYRSQHRIEQLIGVSYSDPLMRTSYQ